MQLSKLIFCFIFALLIIAISVCESQDCAKPRKTVHVSRSGYADFATIQSAIDYSVPSGNSQWIHIRIAPGIYREKVVIPMDKPCIYLEGAGRTITSVEWDDHGNAHFSATFNSKANKTVAKGLAFKDCAKPRKTVHVSRSGYADFATIQSAIDYSVPSGNSQWIHIRIAPGIYREKVVIPMDKPCIYLEGAGRTITSVEWDDHGNAHFSATFNSKANKTVAKGLAFKNTYNLVEQRSVIQAVAARIHADKCAFIDCGFLGVQDTLFDSYGRHYYYNCYIQGGTDFIFGCGQSIFEASQINFSMGLGPKMDGVITASERDSDDSGAFVFNNCNITGSGGKAQLGRALEDYARVIIANSFLSDVVRPEGWSSMGHDVSKITFVENGCRGPGANEHQRVPWMKHLSGSELDQFVNISFIDTEGWIADLPLKS